MTAYYRAELVRIIRIEARHAYVVWRGMVKRVNPRELTSVGDGRSEAAS